MSATKSSCMSIARTEPRRRINGIARLGLYLVLQAVLLFGPLCIATVLALALLVLGLTEGMRWARLACRAWPVALVALSPALAGIPLGAWGTEEFITLWAPSLARSARLFMVFQSAAWLSHGMSPVELNDSVKPLLGWLGPRAAGAVARSASLTLAFLPWTQAETRRANEAALLRGSDPIRRPIRHLSAMAVPVSVRSLEKARLSAEALSLRDPGFNADCGKEEPCRT